MTKSFTQWSTLALALASTGAGAASPPNYDALQNLAPSPRLSARAPLQAGKELMSRQASAPGVAHQNEQQGVPTFVWADHQEPMTAARARQLKGLKPEEAAREQLTRYLPLYGHTSLASAGASLKALSTDASGVTVATFTQQVDGVEVFRQELKVLLDRNNALVALSGGLSPSTAIPRASTRPLGARTQWTPAQAVAAAYQDLTGKTLDGGLLERMSARDGDAYTHYQLASYARPLAQGFAIPARARQVLYPLPGGLEPAYYVEINTESSADNDSDYYSYVLSATDGRLLMRHNLTVNADFGYRVWADTTSPFTPQDGPSGGTVSPHPTGTPGTVGTPPFVAPSLISLQNAPFSRNDPWLAPGATQTLGNNVDAYADLAAPDGFGTGDIRASVTAPGVFDRSMNMMQQPGANAEQVQAAVTQLFYVNNWLHDWFYDSGFDEVAGNAQTSNFGRGGREADSIRAEAQDNGGRNNANMSTPADGGRPRMQMYLFDNDTKYMDVTAPASVAGRYTVGAATFGPQSYDLTGPVVLAASGSPSNTLGCEAFTNAAAVAGKIALVDRGTCSFVIKVRNAQAAGATGVIIANNAEALITPADTAPDVTIPVQSVKLSDGTKLRGAIPGLTTRLFRQLKLDLDGTIDNGIVAHEWGHYISNRLIGNANGLINNQGGSMGEGWGDFHALLMVTRAEDINVAANANWNGVYSAAEYATRGGISADSTYFGIRRVGYSSDLTKNALTFKHIADGVALPTTAPITPNGAVNSEVHNAGEVWATMLWDCYTSLLRAYPFPEAQRRMKQYLVNGYKLTPVAPTYLEARDAIIAAATAADKADGDRFWLAFARRGAGAGAVAPPRYSTNHAGVQESYDLIALSNLSLELNKLPGQVCDADDILDNGESAVLRFKVRNLGPDQTVASDLRLSVSSTVVTLGNNGQVTLPLLKSGQEAEATVAVSLQGATTRQAVRFIAFTRQAGPPQRDNLKGQLDILVNFDEALNASATEDVEAYNLPWTVQHVSSLSNLDWGLLAYPTATNHVFYGENADAPSDMRLISPALQVSTTQPFVLNFKQAWDFEFSGTTYYDGAVIELSQDDGQSWVDVGTSLYNGTIFAYTGNVNPLQNRRGVVGTSAGFPAFVSSTLNLGTTYAGKTVRLRFRIGSDSNGAGAGWLLDDLAFSGITNTPFTSVVAEDGVCTTNFPPTVNAGPDVRVDERTTVTLQGTVTAATGSTTSAQWTQLSGPTVTLRDPYTFAPSFVAPEVTAPVQLVFQLTGYSGNVSATDTVVVTVLNVNRAPTVNAGVAGVVDERVSYTLMGSASDADGDTLTYSWTQTAGTPAVLRNANALQATFTAPEVLLDETLTFSLAVSDGQATVRATVNVTVRNVNRVPVANAGESFSVRPGSQASLNGSRSADPDGDAITYTWTQVSGPAVTLSSTTTATPSFTAPAVSTRTELRFQLVVKDAALSSDPAFVTVTVTNETNQPPTANAGVTGSVDERASYTLMGSASDAEGDTLTYAWVQKAGTPVALRNATTLQPSFTAPEVTADETLTFELAVSDGQSTTRASVDVLVRNVNRAPIANAGESFSVNAGETARLNGGRSSDPDGDTLTYAWTQVSGPAVTLTGATTATPSFTAPVVDTQTDLRFQLVVKDATLTSAPATVTVTVKHVNRAPTANAGMTGSVDERASYTLMGSASDADGDTLSYTWVQKAGTPVALRNANTLQPSFTAPEVTADETLTFEFAVSDGKATTRASVDVLVRNVNRAPIANAGEAFSVNAGESVSLNGSRSSDPDGDTLTYAWTQVSGPPVTLTGATTATPSFTAPDTGAQLRFHLVVKDATLSSQPATVTVTVNPVNRPPTANAGVAGVVNELANYTLSGSASDPDGDSLTYVWAQQTGPTVALRNATTLQPSFTAPEVRLDETLVFELLVSDGKATARSSVTVTVRNINRAPTADAGDAFSVESNMQAILDGRRSSDPDNEMLTYEWTQVLGPTVTLLQATTSRPAFTAPVAVAGTQLRFRLVVRDAQFTSEPAFVTVTITRGQNRAPTVNAGMSGTVDERTSYTLSGSASDEDGDPLTYAWKQLAGPPVDLINATTLQPRFTAPEVTADQTLVFELAANDGLATTRSSVAVTVRNVNRAPVADAGDAFSVNAGDTARLNGSRSSDVDGDSLTYTWTQVSGPPVTLTGPAATPSFTAPVVRTSTELRFQLVVKDATLTSAPAFVTVTIKPVNRAPTANAGVTGSVDERASYKLMGSASDEDGDVLTYAWVQKAGTPVALSNANTLQPSFTAPEVTADETLTFELTVSDGQATARASVDVVVRNVNRAPTANAGESFSVNAGDLARLNGGRSADADGDTLTYAWTQVSGPAVTLTGATTATPSFTAPVVDAQTDLRFQLVVKDATLTSAPATVTVTVKHVNRAPTANAGMTGSVDERALYALAGSASDPDGDTLSFSWVQKAGTPVALRNATTLQPSFIAPEVSADETLTFELTVSDGKATTRASVDVTVRNVNRVPIANAGTALSVTTGEPVSLNGSRSSDPDGDALSYTWTQASGPAVTLTNATTVTPSFTAPSVNTQTELRFQLVVRDGSLISEPAFVTVTVKTGNRAPTANAGLAGTVDERASYTLSGSASDADGDTLSYTWVQKSGTPAALRNATTLQASFTAPEVSADETLSFELVVSDGKATTRASVDVTVRNVNRAPVAVVSDAFSVNAEAPAQLNGGRSTDADGDTLSYAWTQVSGPAVTLSGATTATATFTAPAVEAQSELRFQLVVKDASLSSEPAYVTVTVTPKPVVPTPTPEPGGCSSTGAGAPFGLLGLALVALARRRRVSLS